MNGFVYYNLPPTANEPELKCEQKDLQGYLEVEVSRINFITSTKTTKKNRASESEIQSGKIPQNELVVCEIIKNSETRTNGTPINNSVIINKENNSASVNEISKEIIVSSILQYSSHNEAQQKEIGNYYNRPNSLDCGGLLQVRFVWCGEHKEDAANITICCQNLHQQPIQAAAENCKSKSKSKYQQLLLKKIHQQETELKQKHKQQVKKRQNLLLSANKKLRYRICTSGALFLEYLRSCKTIQIIVTATSTSSGSSSSCSTTAKPLGQAQLSLPLLALLKKFKHNIVKGHNFEHTTKVYTLYRENLESCGKSLRKSGEIQLRFRMLFAPTAAASVTAAAAQHVNVVMHEKHHHHLHNNHCHHQHHHHRHHQLGAGKNSKLSKDAQVDIPKRLSTQTKSEEIVEAMKKLDAKLMAYLAGETEIRTKHSNSSSSLSCEKEVKHEVELNLENNNKISYNIEDLLPVTKLNIFKTISSIKLDMEALTLQAQGTKCMQLLQHEIEPIFTVECQLSNELIKRVPRHNMFHIMQFESEKFQSLTQCTRFDQQAERAVKLELHEEQLSDENANKTELEFGRIHFTVWWREPGTCLNEMLGMGVLELKDLYNDSLLEQCKRIEIQRRGKHLACLYFKITLKRENFKPPSPSSSLFLTQQPLVESDSEKTPATGKQQKTPTTTGQQQTTAQCVSSASSSNSGNIGGTDKGEYADNFLYLKHTKIQ